MANCILGVDPGANGAICLLDPGSSAILGLEDLGQDPYKIASVLDQWSENIRFAVVEDVHAMPDQGVVSMFNFGKSFGVITGMIYSYMIPIYFVKPSVWKMSMKLSKDKNLSREKAGNLYPLFKEKFARKKDADRAEAVLIAEFGRRFL